MPLIPKSSFLILFFAYLFSALSCYLNKGYFSVGGVVFLLISLFLLCFFFVPGKQKKLIPGARDYLKWLLFASILLANLEFSEDMNGFLSFSMLALRGGLTLSMLISLVFLFSKKRGRWFFWSLFILAILIRLAVMRISVDPQVDIFDMLKHAPLSLLKGENPYEHPDSLPILKEGWQRPYAYFTYGPATLFFFLPFNLLFKDPRYFLILTEGLAALILYQLLSDKKSAGFKNLIPLVFLYYPLFTRMTKTAYLEPVIVLLFFLGFWFLNNNKYLKACFAFACALSMKWVYFLFLPFLFLLNKKKFLKGLLVFFMVISLFYWPFIKLNFEAFYKSTVLFFISGPNLWFNWASLTVQTLFFRQFHFVPHLAFWLPPIILVFIFLVLNFKKKLSHLVAATATIILVFFLFSPQGLIHYYYFISSLILLALSFVLRESKEGER